MANTGKIVKCECEECKRKKKIHYYVPCRKKDSPHPDDNLGIYITGRYEEDSKKPQFTCQINQAGIHIEGWLQFVYVLNAKEAQSRERRKKNMERPHEVYTLSGDLDRTAKTFLFLVTDEWSLQKHGKEVGAGSLKRINKTNLEIDVNIGNPKGFGSRRIQAKLRPYPIATKIPRLSEWDINQLSYTEQAEIRPVETVPLPTPYLKEIYQKLSPEYLIDKIEGWYNVPRVEHRREWQTLKRFNYLGAIARVIGEIFEIHQISMWPTLRWHICNHLSRYRYGEGKSHTFLHELALINAQTVRFKPTDLEYLGKKGINLTLPPKPKDDFFVYEVTLKILNIEKPSIKKPDFIPGLGFAIGIGIITIKKSLHGLKTKIYKFNINLKIISFGVTIGFNVGSINDGMEFSYDDWNERHFQGDVTIYEGSGWVARGKGQSYSYSKMRIWGNKIFEPLNFNFSGESPIFGAGAGISLSMSFGTIIANGEKPSVTKVETEPKFFPISGTEKSKTHFLFGCAVLENEGRQMVRKFCAKELFYLMSSSSRIRLDGYTDTVDCKKRNKELSTLRIENTWQVIKDTMGKKIPVTIDMTPNPLGEEPASKKIKPETRDVDWRKIEIFLNGRGILRLREL